MRAGTGRDLAAGAGPQAGGDLAGHDRWGIEGSCGELVEAASAHCTEMVFLAPGLEACLEHHRRRPWEPHKYASREARDAELENLQAWAAGYCERRDPWSYHAHRRIFDSFSGPESERPGTRPCGRRDARSPTD